MRIRTKYVSEWNIRTMGVYEVILGQPHCVDVALKTLSSKGAPVAEPRSLKIER